jgi:hypothetical protein
LFFKLEVKKVGCKPLQAFFSDFLKMIFNIKIIFLAVWDSFHFIFWINITISIRILKINQKKIMADINIVNWNPMPGCNA